MMRNAAKAIALSFAVSLVALVPRLNAASQETVLQTGERLAFECLTCHRRDGKDLGIPGLIGMSEADIVTALTLYKTGLRPNRVMVSVASGLDQRQMSAVARYLSGLSKN